jgi:2Fe-2S ferredoxin
LVSGHVIIDPRWHGRPPASGEEEDDIVEYAFGLARTSRLGRQITITEALEGSAARPPVGAPRTLLPG